MSSHIWSTADDVPCPRTYRAVSAQRVLFPVARPHTPLSENPSVISRPGQQLDARRAPHVLLKVTSSPTQLPPPLASCVTRSERTLRSRTGSSKAGPSIAGSDLDWKSPDR